MSDTNKMRRGRLAYIIFIMGGILTGAAVYGAVWYTAADPDPQVAYRTYTVPTLPIKLPNLVPGQALRVTVVNTKTATATDEPKWKYWWLKYKPFVSESRCLPQEGTTCYWCEPGQMPSSDNFSFLFLCRKAIEESPPSRKP